MFILAEFSLCSEASIMKRAPVANPNERTWNSDINHRIRDECKLIAIKFQINYMYMYKKFAENLYLFVPFIQTSAVVVTRSDALDRSLSGALRAAGGSACLG